ncbi:nuclease-related domain-containing protein [Mycoplasma sp. 128]
MNNLLTVLKEEIQNTTVETNNAAPVANPTIIKNGLIAAMVILILLAVAGFVIFLFYRLKIKKKLGRGRDFEKEFAKKIQQWSSSQDFFFIPSSLLKYEKKLFEVDGILISNRGVIVIEMKSFNADIEGDYNNNVWWKVKPKVRYEIKNHLKQNDKHIEHLQNIIGKDINVYSFLIYENFGTNKINIASVPDWALVFKDNEFESKMQYYKEAIESSYDRQDVVETYNKIEKAITHSAKDKAKFATFFK